jgi:hypothetical protein
MEAVERAGEDGLAVPRPSSEIPTEKIFDSDRDRAAREVLASLQRRQGISNTTLITLCSTTFVLGIALTLMVSGRPEPRGSLEAAPSAPASAAVFAQVPAPATPTAGEPVVVSLPPPAALPLVLRPALARPARAVRPRPVRAVHAAPPAPAPWVDPFAE